MAQRDGRESHRQQRTNRQQKDATKAAISTMTTGPTAAQDRNRTYFFRLIRQLPPYLINDQIFWGGLWSKDTQPHWCSFGAITGRPIFT